MTLNAQTQTKKLPELTKDQYADIQGFIVYGYGSLPFGKYLFLHVDDVAKAKQWLAQVKPTIMTVETWYEGEALDVAVNLAFTHSGLQTLGLAEQTLETFSREFREGMTERVRARNIGDIGKSAPDYWDVMNPKTFGTEDETHMLLIFNCRTKALLEETVISAPFDQIGTPESGVRKVDEQYGSTPSSKKEPFGFRDGISNPWIAGTRDLKLGQTSIVKQRGDHEVVIDLTYDPVIKTGEFILGYENEYGQLPQTPMVWGEANVDLPEVPLDEIPHGVENLRDFGKNGSYLVYRKLEQHVKAFWEYMAENAENDPQLMARLSAKCVGRWASGVPLALSPDKDNPDLAKQAIESRNNSLINNFHYIDPNMTNDDRYGFACPVGSHIRRSNARDSLIDDWTKPTVAERFANNNQHRLMRRSVSWGKLADHQVHEPDFIEQKGAPLEITYNHSGEWGSDEAGTGIHFFAVNANINQQFEFVMQAWSNDGHFNGLYENKDPIIGKNSDEPDDPSRMDVPRKDNYREKFTDVQRFVTVRGGAYFFIPSMRALDYLVSL